ncbi:Cse1-domain-containing protein [Thamnocephalis sphaerospora]|uniref:Cse1-domain-containing protein n=1 Tax=Thamnocephalis sphaerospora TaxID=78915 RepID=A0A4P9XW58_9FUNG|nr:Cse1-domain-containing protein [Thamnocephalis sphaerospora]|eukprot:RKP10272.1 Cse1-domain-containing protein [Thamnocephalis sphaerospora]
MEVNDQNLQVLAQYLGQTLDPSRRREAEQFLQSVEKNAGFPVLVLTLTAKDDAEAHIRFAAALLLKNFVRRNWSTDGEDKIAQADRLAIKASIVDVLVKVPAKLQLQLGEVISTIADNDFPADWSDLVPNLVGKLDPQNYTVNNGILQTAHFLFKRWRHEFSSNELFSEIKFVLEIFAAPFLNLVKACFNTDQMIEKSAQDAAALPVLLESMFLSAKVFYSLNAQDLPEFFEDHMAEFMGIWYKYLTYTNPLVESTDADEAGPLEKLRASICEIVDLYAKRYEELFPMMPDFISTIWGMLTKLSLDVKNDILACRALAFLATVVKIPRNRSLFDNEQTLKEICEKVVLQNMSMRESDEELIEDEPIIFIRKDLEGSENDTRRKAATDLVQGLQEQFEAQTANIISMYITQFLQRYSTNPAANWRDKDIAIYLLTSIAARSTSTQGAISTSKFVNVVDFFSNNVLTDLQAPANTVHPVLQMDAIKYVSTFRHQLTKEQLMSVFPLLAERLGSEHTVVHTYAAICIERVLAIKRDNVYIITAADVQPYTDSLLANLFTHLEKSQSPEKLAENEFLIKAIMRLLATARGNISQPQPIAAKIAAIVEVISTNPSNPRFNHYAFESIGTLIRYNPTALVQLEETLFPAFQSILQRDVSEFIPYSIQLIAAMLELHPDVPALYAGMLQPFLQPPLWEAQGNIPALTRLIKVYIAKDAAGIAARGQIEPVLGVFQKLIASKLNDQHGFDILSSIAMHLPADQLSGYLPPVLHLLLNRLQSSRTEKFTLAFVSLVCYFAASENPALGPDNTIKMFETVQSGLFVNIARSIILPAVSQLFDPLDCKTCAIGLTQLLTHSTAMQQQPNVQLWYVLVDALAWLALTEIASCR